MSCPTCGQETKIRKPRSTPQNRYLWGVVYELLSAHTGYTTDEIHEICKHKFLKAFIEIAGEEIEITKSTTSLTTVEMENYLTKIREWASIHLQLSIPEPNE